MRFFLAVLFLWVVTVAYGGEVSVLAGLPPISLWGLWTAALYLVCWIALETKFTSFQDKMSGLLGYTFVVIFYITMSETYLTIIPSDSDPDHPNLWATVFLAVNMLGPIVMISAGCMRATIQGGGTDV